MEKYISLLFLAFFSFTNSHEPHASEQGKITAQKDIFQTEGTYINVFIGADKTIFLENEEIIFEDVEGKLRDRVRSMPFKPDQKIVYRIFGDENLKHGYIMDVNQKMVSGYRPHQTQKYLLNTTQLNIDGQNWLQAIDMKDLRKID